MARRPGIALERTVRPFLPPGVRPDRGRYGFLGGSEPSGAVVDTDGNGVPDLEWGARVGAETVTLEQLGIRLQDPLMDFEELSRDTHVLRVTNPEDADQYVDVEVIDNIRFRNKSRQTSSYKLNNTPDD